MPHQSIKVLPGVDRNETTALNQAGVSFSQLIRFFYDRNGNGLVQKLGGWSRFYGVAETAIVRALWAWADTNDVTHLAVGCQSDGSNHAQLNVITNGTQIAITPRYAQDDVTPTATTTMGSSTVLMTDATTTNISNYDIVYIMTHMAIDGLVLFGMYPTTQVSASTYDITATDIFGNPLPATSSTSTVAVALFTTISSNSAVTVTLNNHGYIVGSTYPVLVSTTVGGVTLFGDYLVNTVVDANNFTIIGQTIATSSTSGSINGGNARFVYSFGVGPLTAGSGYGIGGYGRGGYGTGTGVQPGTGNPIAATDWVLDNFGEELVAVAETTTPPLFQPIYIWDPLSGSSLAQALPNGPVFSDGAFVAMPERQIVAWGSTFTGIPDPLLLRWCDINNFSVWIGQPTNQAGEFRIPRGSKIVSCIQGPQQALVFTDIDVWSMQYIGPPNVYGFNLIGTGCGLIGRKAVSSFNGVIYWMGQSQFYTLSADGVTQLACPVWDIAFQDLDYAHATNIRIAVNARFGEVTWYYPLSGGSGENVSYVKYNTYLGTWDYGTLGRSAWIDQSVLGAPIGADPVSRYIYQHETSPDADGTPMLASFQTGYFALQDGDYKVFVDQFWPDMRWETYGGVSSATVNVTFYVVDYPGQTPTVYGPYPTTQATTFFSPRFRGRLISIEFSSSDIGSFWRLGIPRYRGQSDGRY